VYLMELKLSHTSKNTAVQRLQSVSYSMVRVPSFCLGDFAVLEVFDEIVNF